MVGNVCLSQQGQLHVSNKKTVFSCNALSVPDALQNPEKKEPNNLTSTLSQRNDQVEVTLL